MTWQVSFNPVTVMDVYKELQEMQSPIASRNQINPVLDAVEEEYLDAFKEFRSEQIHYEFKNYKNYYADARRQNERDSSVSFKDKRFFIQGQDSRQSSVVFSMGKQDPSNTFDRQGSVEEEVPEAEQSQPLIEIAREEEEMRCTPEISPVSSKKKKEKLSPQNYKSINQNLKALLNDLPNQVVFETQGSDYIEDKLIEPKRPNQLRSMTIKADQI